MFLHKLRLLGLLLYKNFLIRKRYWKSALLLEILTTLLLFLAIWALRNQIPREATNSGADTRNNTVYEVRTADNYIENSKRVMLVPDNQFTKNLARRIRLCLNGHVSTNTYPSEEEMLKEQHKDRSSFRKGIGLVFEDKNVNNATEHFKYKIEYPSSFPTALYSELLLPGNDVFEREFTGVQLCVDQSLIQIKKDDALTVQIYTQQMPKPAEASSSMVDTEIKRVFCGFAVAAFAVPLCIETAHASKEKFLGINVLMAMNGVPNYLNLLGWLVSGLIFSLFYTVPIVLLMSFYTTVEQPISFIHYGNPFIFWLLLTLNVAHLLAFGEHISAYFTRSLFMTTGLLILYVGAIILQQHGIKDNGLGIVPFLGVVFPNLLLFRGIEEMNYYEDIRKGVNFGNLFSTANRNYGVQGSMGMVLILSVIGIIINSLMANYIYAMNPGKYGVRRGPFYFLKCLKRKKKMPEHVESFEFTDVGDQPFEIITDNIYAPGIQIRNLKKQYRTSLLSQTKVYALRGVSVDFFQGQITALLGHNGAGKTTMMSILSGMIGPTEGLVLVNGKNVKDEIDEIMNETGLCPQENMLFPQLSVFEQMRLFSMFKNKNKSMPVTDTEVAQLLSQLKLLDKQNALPTELSGGQKRRVSLGMALVGDSKTLILDEPTSGLDPESKRDIWNVLLRLKGRKTILISTHDMEEADVLGDRIAIMHTGQLKSYGTPMFLKKLMGGENMELTLSTEPRCNTTKVCTFLDEGSHVVIDELGKIVLNVPNNDKLPDSLDELEQNKKELGITGMSVSVITLEKVFLKVIEDNADASKTRQPFSLATEKLDSEKQIWQTWRGLLFKKATYSLKNLSTIITMLVLLVVGLLCMIFILMDHSPSSTEEMPLRPDMYHNVKDYYKINRYSKAFGNSYKSIIGESDAASIEYKNGESLTNVLLDIGLHDMSDYYYRHVVAAEFSSDHANNKVFATALYNPKFARFAQPVSINLVSNAILRALTSDNYSIEMSVQETPEMDSFVIKPRQVTTVEAYVVSLLFAFFLYPAVALFVVHPIRETLTNVKHLQRMTGVSCFSYWGTMFLFDFLLFFYMIICLIVGFIIADKVLDFKMFGLPEVFILLGLYTLFAVNVLPLIYIFTFLMKSTTAAMKLLTLVPLGLVLVELIMIIVKFGWENHNRILNIIRFFQKSIFLITPYISFLHGHVTFFYNAKINGDCKKLYAYDKNSICSSPFCCDIKCRDDICENVNPYFDQFNEDVSFSAAFLVLCLTPILYFTLLCGLEYKVVEKFIANMHAGMPDNTDATFEEQVKNVKREIAFEVSKLGIEGVKTGKYQSTTDNEAEESSETNDEEHQDHVFLVYELRKLYRNFIAVQDISFGVNESECFGLLGVNGAGKSTTFKMMTGEVIPNHGIIHLRDKNSRDDQSYLKNLGYCPQNDAIVRSLNSYDHLRLFARLRGIPESNVEEEVQGWIDKLNLNVCALQPSGTYSGGNKRRLNIAMALIGIPHLVLLDEPTTGVDPAARRSLWNTIQSCQATGQAVILTSHSMEECEALCNRLAIMVDGKFVCIGPSVELKQRFGAGYDVQLQMNPEKSKNEIDGIKQDLIGALPCEVVDENPGYLKCHVLSANITWRQMHNVMLGLKNHYCCIEDYSVLSSTLEQLFLIFAKAANKTNRRTI